MNCMTICIRNLSGSWSTVSTIRKRIRTEHSSFSSTHDTSILDQGLLRSDQIWFCERNERLETSLFPLSDFRLRRGFDNLEKAYLAGRFGALPYIRG